MHDPREAPVLLGGVRDGEVMQVDHLVFSNPDETESVNSKFEPYF